METKSRCAFRLRRRVVFTLAALAALSLLPSAMTPVRAQSPEAPRFTAPTLPIGDKQVVGLVVDKQKQPVPGLVVYLTWHWSAPQKSGGPITGSRTVGQATTDAQGHFLFSKLPAGHYDYSVYSPKSQYVSLQASLALSESDMEKTLRLVVYKGVLVTGRVVDGATGKPLADVSVGAGSIPPGGSLAKWGYWEMPTIASTDASGIYHLRVAPGPVFVGVGRVSNGTLFSQRIMEAVQKVNARAGQAASMPDLSVFLRPLLVCVGPDGKPISNTAFRIVPNNLAKVGFITDAQTDASGTVVLGRGVGDDETGQSASFSIVQGELAASGTFHWLPKKPLVVEVNGQKTTYPDGVATITLLAGSTSPVTGTVVSEDGMPIPNALVRVFEMDPHSHYGVGDRVFKTDASGGFRAPLDPNGGEYHAYIRADGFNQVNVSDKPLSIVPGKPTDLGSVRLVKADGSVSGTVVDAVGKPMAGVLAFVRGGKTFLSAAVTDDQGKFRIPNVVAGERLMLHLCLHGEAPDSGQALSQSNEEMNIPDAYANPTPVKIVWRPQP